MLAAAWLLAALATVVALAAPAYPQATVPPEITSAGPFTVAEGTTPVATLTAMDSDTAPNQLIWSIPSGWSGRRGLRAVHAEPGGRPGLRGGPGLRSPDDADTDGTYAVTVQVSDGTDNGHGGADG